MKKKKLLIVLFLSTLIVVFLVNNSPYFVFRPIMFKLKGVESTDLSDLYFNPYDFGSEINEYDLEYYTPSHKFEANKNFVNYEELRFFISDSNSLQGVHFDISEYNSNPNTTNKILLEAKPDTVNLLGDEYLEGFYDREQGLKSISYIDYENKIIGNFIYTTYDESMIWIQLFEY